MVVRGKEKMKIEKNDLKSPRISRTMFLGVIKKTLASSPGNGL